MDQQKKNPFKEARTKHNQSGNENHFQSAYDVYKATGIGSSTIDALEADAERGVSYKTVLKLAKHYGVSMDYLCGLSKTPHVTPEMSAAAEYTGLSEKSAETLHMINERNPAFLSALSFLLENLSFYRTVIDPVLRFTRKQHLVSGDASAGDDFFTDNTFTEEEWAFMERLINNGITLMEPAETEKYVAVEAGNALTRLLGRFIYPSQTIDDYEQEEDKYWLTGRR